MPRLNSANNADTTLSAGITATSTSLTVVDSSLFPNAPFRITVDAEIIEVGAIDRATNTFSSLVRGQEGTTAASHSAGASVQNRFTAGTYSELATDADLDSVSSSLTAHTSNTSNPHSVTAAQVGSYTKAESDAKYPLKGGEVLWTGNLLMNETHTVTPSKPLGDCPNGWCLVWGQVGGDYDYNYTFVHKYHATLGAPGAGYGVWFPTINSWDMPGSKYCYVNNTTITGHTRNDDTTNERSTTELKAVLSW